MLFKYIFIYILILKVCKCAIFLEEDSSSSICVTINEENQKNFHMILEYLEKSNRKWETLNEENQKNLENSIRKIETKVEDLNKELNEKTQKMFQNISDNLENSNRKLEAKFEDLNKTVIEENQKILHNISNYLKNYTKNIEDKEKHRRKELIAESQKLLQKISDNLEISNKSLKVKKEHLKEVEESIKMTMKISDDESVESFIVKHQLALHFLIQEKMINQERFQPIAALKEPTDCSEILVSGETKSGFYFIYPFICHCTKPVKVYCDMETDGGGWTVFLQRTNALNPVNFTSNWNSYKKGFGNEEEYWIGNEALHIMTVNRNYALRMEAKGSEGREIWGVWNSIVVLSEDEKFKLVVTGYNAKSTAYQRFDYHTDNYFSTYDVDNDQRDSQNCATVLRGGFWYNNCAYINPTGEHGRKGMDGLYFYPWSKKDNTERHATWLQLKIRPLVCNSKLPAINFNKHDCRSNIK